ncbi:hypothetical protein DUNSADRAFT_13663 [Dunaliella salina]|uniref:Encoded protein n=1 Tax=Dunaliella salina TaxID=3046 RepID=A0ABQ7G8W7_DUNSA|nr:hypothetical protein DUNSADRAFT_13663 [Dunaliella salina]|eukprot:KAF5831052.1 hypothetical protein DUNSADRAFT_13663 [Dunaliella salina]
MPVGEAFFKHLKPRRAPALVHRALRNLDSGQYAVPASYQVLLRFPAEELKNKQRKPMKALLPENHLMHKFYIRHPEARLEPVPLQSFKPPLAKQFASRQLQLMQQGKGKVCEDEAFALAEKEFMGRIQSLASHRGGMPARLSLVQQDEGRFLAEALEEVAARKK